MSTTVFLQRNSNMFRSLSFLTSIVQLDKWHITRCQSKHYVHYLPVLKDVRCKNHIYQFLATVFDQSNPSLCHHWSAVHHYPCHHPISTTQSGGNCVDNMQKLVKIGQNFSVTIRLCHFEITSVIKDYNMQLMHWNMARYPCYYISQQMTEGFSIVIIIITDLYSAVRS